MLSKMRVATKLTIGFGLVIVLLLAVSAISLLRMSELNGQLHVVGGQLWPRVAMLGEVRHESNTIAIALRSMMLAENGADRARSREVVMAGRQSINENLERLDQLATHPRDRELLEAIRRERARYIVGQDQLIELISNEHLPEARAYLNNALRPQLADYQSAIAAAAEFQSQSLHAGIDQAATATEAARLQVLVSAGAALVVALLAGFLIMRSLAREMGGEPGYAAKVAHRVAEGDFTAKVVLRSGDRTSLLAAMKEMVGKLSMAFGEIHAAGGALVAASEEVGTSVQQQAAMSSQMSSAVAEITSTMEEFSASSSEIAQNAAVVVDMAQQTLANSRKGAEGVRMVLERMEDIRNDNEHNLREIMALGARSKEIGRIMEIINAVADQTRLIAFNAALEASSAGEAGRRFSVVAAEIRRLADSVADSSEDVAAKVGEIQDSINRLVVTSEKSASVIVAGTEASDEAAHNLDEILETAAGTDSAAQQISLATQQQKTASTQVVVALREIVGANRHGAQSTERVVQVGKELKRLAADLFETTRRFRYGDDDGGGRRADAAAPGA
ncbi:methyl-accepting chemotaxis protein [Thauera chlorobenzoica]|uniref:Methyl-accepting chemotaxis protein n=1 Tax=Thauera chlorobenzoica TaxID=96773 RepID=A0A1H5UBP3_9RHOO|nr:methyl-accepting chemotaxis protein [Thauera chlorobenzoica]APR03836.1 Methyl-accepting chemotaxis protein [Thauera chlorobenzoica]SEF72434.1 methyl-accepting chemotaxis protein [Thauera chlorobenzoica]